MQKTIECPLCDELFTIETLRTENICPEDGCGCKIVTPPPELISIKCQNDACGKQFDTTAIKEYQTMFDCPHCGMLHYADEAENGWVPSLVLDQ